MVRYYKLRPTAKDPVKATEGSVGYDLFADIEEPVAMEPGTRRLIPTGLVLDIPWHHEVQIRPRSGLAYRHGVTVLNAPGTIDSDYKEEVYVLLINMGRVPYTVEPGDRIAQAVPASTLRHTNFTQALHKPSSPRGGFGSTGR